MRSVLAIAIIALFSAVLVRFSERYGPPNSGGEAEPGADGGLSILVGSRGHLLPTQPLTGGSESFEDALTIGDLVLKNNDFGPGLRAAVLGPDRGFQSFENYALAHAPEDVLAFTRLVEDAPVGSFMISAVQGDVQAPAVLAQQLDDLARALGAQVSPFRAPQASWALIAWKRAAGWVNVAEAYSEDQGVSLAYTLPRSREVLENSLGSAFGKRARRLYYTEAKGPQVLSLFDSRFSASASPPDYGSTPWAWHGGVSKKGIYLRPSHQAPAWIRWEGLLVREGCRLEVQLAPAHPQSLSECIVLVDERPLLVHRVDRASGKWLALELDLQPYAGRVISIEFRSSVVHGGTRGSAIWGDALIRWGTES